MLETQARRRRRTDTQVPMPSPSTTLLACKSRSRCHSVAPSFMESPGSLALCSTRCRDLCLPRVEEERCCYVDDEWLSFARTDWRQRTGVVRAVRKRVRPDSDQFRRFTRRQKRESMPRAVDLSTPSTVNG